MSLFVISDILNLYFKKNFKISFFNLFLLIGYTYFNIFNYLQICYLRK